LPRNDEGKKDADDAGNDAGADGSAGNADEEVACLPSFSGCAAPVFHSIKKRAERALLFSGEALWKKEVAMGREAWRSRSG
jgi:hypothetical protein